MMGFFDKLHYKLCYAAKFVVAFFIWLLANLLVKKPSHIEYKKPPIYYRNKDYL